MIDGTEGATKLVLTADGRRWTQTFSSADLAAENRLALRAGEMIRARRSSGEGTIYHFREAIVAHFRCFRAFRS